VLAYGFPAEEEVDAPPCCWMAAGPPEPFGNFEAFDGAGVFIPACSCIFLGGDKIHFNIKYSVIYIINKTKMECHA
jgi:hypothetical protein